jgi:hypothetical protein
MAFGKSKRLKSYCPDPCHSPKGAYSFPPNKDSIKPKKKRIKHPYQGLRYRRLDKLH